MYFTKFLVLISLLLWHHLTLALTSDAGQQVTIDSNTAHYDDKTGTSVYTGNVITIQGSLHIESDKLVVYTQQGKLEKMVFTGKPAIFRQISEDQQNIHGEALTGEFYPKKNKLILIEKAMVSQGNNRSESELIIYDSKNSIIKAGEKHSDSKRVHSVFQSNSVPTSSP